MKERALYRTRGDLGYANLELKNLYARGILDRASGTCRHWKNCLRVLERGLCYAMDLTG
jgi:uncharacterized protein YqgQ